MIGWAAPAATSPASHGLAQRSRFPSPCPLPPILPHPTRAATAVRRVWASLCRLPAGRSYSPARETPVHTCAHLSTPEHTQKKHETQPPPSLLLCLLCQSLPPRNLPEWLGWWRQGPQRPARSGPSPAAWPPPGPRAWPFSSPASSGVYFAPSCSQGPGHGRPWHGTADSPSVTGDGGRADGGAVQGPRGTQRQPKASPAGWPSSRAATSPC